MNYKGRETDHALIVVNNCLMKTEIVPPRSTTSHCHASDNKFDYAARNRLIVVLILSITFMIIEIIGGVLSNSTAVLTDAVHMGIDVTSFLISLAAIYLATKRPIQKLSFGYVRAEVIGALLSVLTLWLGTGILVHMAIGRCMNQTFEVNPTEMIVVASCGVVFNIIMFGVLHANLCGSSIPHHGHSHGGNHGHSHGGNHGYSHEGNHEYLPHKNDNLSRSNEMLVVDIVSGQTQERISNVLESSKNLNIRAAIIHVIGDFVQSVGVLIAAILIKVKPEYKIADPICTFVFSVLVLITTFTIMRDIVVVLMEGVPSNVNYTRLVNDLLQLPGVRNVHSLHIWSLSMQKTALSVHIAIDLDQDCLTVLNQAQEMLRREYSISRTTIQIEPYDEHVMNSCEDCRRPGT